MRIQIGQLIPEEAKRPFEAAHHPAVPFRSQRKNDCCATPSGRSPFIGRSSAAHEDRALNLAQVTAMDGIPEAARRRIRDFQALIAQHSRALEELRAGGGDWTDSARRLRMLEIALELMRGQITTPPQPGSCNPGRLPSIAR